MKRGTSQLGKSPLLLMFVALLAAVYPGAGSLPLLGAARTEPQAHQYKASSSKAEPVFTKAKVPFRVGEILNYRVDWAAFTAAASLRLSVPEQRDLYGQDAWHFRATAHTLSPVRTLFAIDDQLDSYSDTTSLESRQYEMYLNEMGKRQDQVLRFVPIGETARGPGPYVIVLAGTRDPVGVLYALRSVDWQRTQEFRAPVYDGHRMYQLSAKRDAANDAVTVAAGNFSASRVAVHLAQNGKEISYINVEIWLANDEAHTPVQFQAQLPFGNVRAELAPAGQ